MYTCNTDSVLWEVHIGNIVRVVGDPYIFYVSAETIESAIAIAKKWIIDTDPDQMEDYLDIVNIKFIGDTILVEEKNTHD